MLENPSQFYRCMEINRMVNLPVLELISLHGSESGAFLAFVPGE